MSLPASLSFEGLRYRYNAGPEALRDLGAEVAPGEVTAILGPNGAGKTTLLHLALGWLKPLAGRVLLDGIPLGGLSRRELGRAMALVPQSERIPFEFSVLDYVLLGRAPHLAPLRAPGPADLAAARAAIERVGIGAFAEREVTALSGGERQLASIARALAQGPRLLLLDEPTSHLDLANKARVMGLVRELAGEGTTILLTTHEPETAAMAATRLFLMRQGRLLASGPADRLFASASLSLTYGLPVEARLVEGRRVALWGPSGPSSPRQRRESPWLDLWRDRVEARARAREASGKGPEADYWKGRAREYDTRARRRLEVPDALRDSILADIVPGDRVIDIGAGTGVWSAAFARRGARVVAIEPSPDMRSVLRERVEDEGLPGIRILEEAWPLPSPPACDLAFSAHALYGSPDFTAFVRAMDEAASSRCMLLLRAPPLDGLMAEAAWLVLGQPHEGPNLHVAYQALLELGIQPSLLVEEEPRIVERRYDSLEEALAELKEGLGLIGPSRFDGALSALLKDRSRGEGQGVSLARHERSGLLRWPSLRARKAGPCSPA